MKRIGPVASCLVLLALIGPAPALAQTAEATGVTDATATTTVGQTQAELASVQRLKAGVASDLLLTTPDYGLKLAPTSRAGQDVDAAAPVLMQQDRRGGLTWLLVGASLFGAGFLVGDDAGTALSVGGALVGAYGVFLLVRD